MLNKIVHQGVHYLLKMFTTKKRAKTEMFTMFTKKYGVVNILVNTQSIGATYLTYIVHYNY